MYYNRKLILWFNYDWPKPNQQQKQQQRRNDNFNQNRFRFNWINLLIITSIVYYDYYDYFWIHLVVFCCVWEFIFGSFFSVFLFSFARYQCFFSFLCCSGKRSVCVCVCLIHSCESFDFFFQWFPPPPSPPTLVYFSYHRFLACLETQTHKTKQNEKFQDQLNLFGQSVSFIHFMLISLQFFAVLFSPQIPMENNNNILVIEKNTPNTYIAMIWLSFFLSFFLNWFLAQNILSFIFVFHVEDKCYC